MLPLERQRFAALRKWLPFLGWWQGRQVFTADVIAGTTVGLVLVPQAMAYAKLAGMPLQTGLFAGSFACMVGGLLGRCGQLQTGPVAMTSLISFAAVSLIVSPTINGDPNPQYLYLMAILALMVGVFRIILGLLKGAVLATLVSKPVLIGFGTAAGIIIASTQFPKWFDISPSVIDLEQYSNSVYRSIIACGYIMHAHWPSLVMGVGSLLGMIAFKRWLPRWPGLLIVLAITGLVSWLINYEAMGGKIIGHISSGLPPFVIPAMPENPGQVFLSLTGGALLVVLIGLLEVMTVTGTVERKLGKSTDLNGELVGQGASSLVAGCTGGFPVSGSLSRSSLNLLAGAHTGLSSVVSGLIVLFTLLFLTPLLEPLPLPALASAILMAVAALVRPQDLWRTWGIRRSDAFFGFATLFATLIAAPNMVLGMAIGVGGNIAYLVWLWMRPRVIVVSPDETSRLSAVDMSEGVCDSLVEGRLIVRIDSRINFLNATSLRDTIKDWARSCPHSTSVVIYACAINSIDSTGCDMLDDLQASLKASGHQLLLADVKVQVRETLASDPRLYDLPILPHPTSPLPG